MNRFFAGLLSFLLPGVGQIYNRDYRGVVPLLIVHGVLFFLLIASFGMLIPVLLFVQIYATVDAVRTAKKQSDPIRLRLFVLLLLVIGAVYYGEISWMEYEYRDFH